MYITGIFLVSIRWSPVGVHARDTARASASPYPMAMNGPSATASNGGPGRFLGHLPVHPYPAVHLLYTSVHCCTPPYTVGYRSGHRQTGLPYTVGYRQRLVNPYVIDQSVRKCPPTANLTVQYGQPYTCCTPAVHCRISAIIDRSAKYGPDSHCLTGTPRSRHDGVHLPYTVGFSIIMTNPA